MDRLILYDLLNVPFNDIILIGNGKRDILTTPPFLGHLGFLLATIAFTYFEDKESRGEYQSPEYSSSEHKHSFLTPSSQSRRF